jgi:tetratricopeptide (TPR) repeat protein
MSHSPTISPPTAASTPTQPSQPLSPSDETLRRLRAEIDATGDAARRARLLAEIAELEESDGDDAAAARDYLAAHEVEPSFRESLEGIARLLDKRSGLKGLGVRFFESLLEAAATPEERVRALLMQSAYMADVAGDVAAATNSARQAAAVHEAPAAEQARAWLELELLAGRSNDLATREQALTERTRFASNRTWRALLLIDRARMASRSGQTQAALMLLEEARGLEGGGTWAATVALEEVSRGRPIGLDTMQATARADLQATSLEALADLIDTAIQDGDRGDALGVPRWAREAGRAADAWLRSAEMRRTARQLDRVAAGLDRALLAVDRMQGDDKRLAQLVVAQARIRLAEQTGNTELAADLAAHRLETETDGPTAAALALRVAEWASTRGHAEDAIQALSRALESDPGCLPARALQLDMLADGNQPSAFSSRLEEFADQLATDGARVRAFTLAAFVWAVRASDVGAARAALTQAAMFGANAAVTARVARVLASIAGDAAWYEEATKRLLTSEPPDKESISLCTELIRIRSARGDAAAVARAMGELVEIPGGAWFGWILEAFPAPSSASAGRDDRDSRARSAIASLAAIDEGDFDRSRTLSVVAAMRAHATGDLATAREGLRRLLDGYPDDAIIATYLGDLDRSAGDLSAAASVASIAAEAAADRTLGAALHIEAAFEHWRAGQRKRAVDELEAAIADAPEASKTAIGWAIWGVDPESLDARRSAIRRAGEVGGDPRVLALERFATAVASGDADVARAALALLDAAPAPLSLAAAIGRLIGSGAAVAADAVDALAQIAASGPGGLLLAAAERTVIARRSDDPEAIAQAARGWFEAGGGLPAALDWLGAAVALGDSREEVQARIAVAESMSGDARESMLASAALLQTHVDLSTPAALVAGRSASVRLANLELAPPGCDPRRRAAALEDLDGALGADAELDALALAAWSLLASSDTVRAREAFERVLEKRPHDLAAWDGLRACAESSGDLALRARASAELGALCHDARRGAAFWEAAALTSIDLGDDANADRALAASFERDPTRPVAFDKLFRRARARKDNATLLTIISRRVDVTDDPDELQKLSWEQARVLRENGDFDGALKAIEQVMILEPDHVGALALLGEINIRRGQFEDAASALARLAALDGAPPKNRVTAAVAAADLYENKLDRADAALDVLLTVRQAKLSTAPVRERLARVAARTGAWQVATATLEELMKERSDRAGRIEAARLSIAIYRDRLGDIQRAAVAVRTLLAEAPDDGEAIDLLLLLDPPPDGKRALLDAARIAVVTNLQSHTIDTATVRRLADVARALDDHALRQAALGALSALGESSAEVDSNVAQHARSKPRIPQVAIPDAMIRSLLAPGDEGPVAELFVILGPTIALALGPNGHVCGVGRRDKVDPRSGLSLRNEIAAWAGALGIEQFDLYVGGKEPKGIQGIPGVPPAMVVGPEVHSPLSPLDRARVARELFAIVRGTTIVRCRDDVAIAAIVVAACKIANLHIDHPPYAVLAEFEKLIGKAISRRTRKLLPNVCDALVATHADARAWSRRALASQDRMAAVASGDPVVTLTDVLGVPMDRLGRTVRDDARAQELLRFVLSPAYVDVRRSLGLEGVA